MKPNPDFHPILDPRLRLNRRHFFGRNATGIGTAALASLLNREGLLGSSFKTNSTVGMPGLPELPHYASKAKRIIYLFQNGAPTHVDLFDHKPGIKPMHGKPVPESYFKGKRFSTMTGDPSGKLMLSPVEPFQQRGQSGAWVSDLLPHTAKMADDLCFVKSMHTDAVNHAPAISFFLSGAEVPGRPTL
ncbi:DUF1501 domain-containing protein, partial [Verrucomicrobia bacterium]|nr:DUF1501 domain-containing protein [Verrucomicrobiota bacterium]